MAAAGANRKDYRQQPTGDERPFTHDVARFAFLDALRALAALGVVATHVDSFRGGARGVQLFFVISGFTLMHSWHQRRTTVGQFYLRRFLRIAPMYYLAIAATLYVQGFRPRYWAPDGISAWDILANVLFVHAWVPNAANSVVMGGWSIGCEMTFYILVPVLVVLARNLWSALAIFAVATACAIVGAKLTAGLAEPGNYIVGHILLLWPVAQFPAFCAGIVAYFAFRTLPDGPWRLPAGLGCMALGLGGAAWLIVHEMGIGYEPQYGVLFGLLLVGLGLAPLPIVVNRVTSFLGRVSYGTYLLHWFVLLFSGLTTYAAPLNEPLKGVFLTVSVFIVSSAVASVTYYAVERPFLALGSLSALPKAAPPTTVHHTELDSRTLVAPTR